MTSTLQTKFQELEDKAHKLSVRERAIILGALAMLLLGLFDQLLLRPWMQEREKIESHKTVILKSLEASNRRIDELQQAILNNPNNQLKASIETLKLLHDEVDESIAEITDGMIAPQKMPVILGEMLSERYGLKVHSVKSKAAERLMSADEQDDHAPSIYRHDLELKMVGSFFQMKDYLAAVEALPDKLLWDHLEYVVEKYPKGSVTLKVHTLSSQEELLRVEH